MLQVQQLFLILQLVLLLLVLEVLEILLNLADVVHPHAALAMVAVIVLGEVFSFLGVNYARDLRPLLDLLDALGRF